MSSQLWETSFQMHSHQGIKECSLPISQLDLDFHRTLSLNLPMWFSDISISTISKKKRKEKKEMSSIKYLYHLPTKHLLHILLQPYYLPFKEQTRLKRLSIGLRMLFIFIHPIHDLGIPILLITQNCKLVRCVKRKKYYY